MSSENTVSLMSSENTVSLYMVRSVHMLRCNFLLHSKPMMETSYSKYKDLDNTPQDHSTMTIINQFCLLESYEGMF